MARIWLTLSLGPHCLLYTILGLFIDIYDPLRRPTAPLYRTAA